MHLRAASSPSTASKAPPARSESAKTTSKATAARRTSSLTSSELPRPSRRHSAQVATSTRQTDKENAPIDKPASDNSSKTGGGLEKQETAKVKIEKSTSSNSTKIKTTTAATALKPKSSNVKAFQSTVSPLMHFDEPAPVPIALFGGLAISGGVSPSHDSSSTSRSVSGPAALQQHTLSATNYTAQQSGYLSVPNSPAPFYNPAATGFGVSPAAVYNPAGVAYHYPTDFSTFFHAQGYTVPSPPGTPLSTSTGAIPSSSGATTTETTPANNNNNQQQQQLYPPSLGLGHPYWYTPATITSSANTSLSLSSVAASSLGLSPANSRSTSASSVASAGVGNANKVATAAAATVVYPIPYGYSTPFVAAPAVPASAPPHGEETTTIRERLEGGAVLSSRGACKFFDVEKGFGFIIDDHAEELGADVFIHYTGIEQTRGFRCLAQHERVEYALVKHSSGRFQALKLRGEHGVPLKGLDDPRQAAAFDRMNSKAAAIWSEDEENVCPPGKGRHRRGGYAPAYYKGNMRAPPPPRIRRTPADEEDDDEEADSCVEVEDE